MIACSKLLTSLLRWRRMHVKDSDQHGFPITATSIAQTLAPCTRIDVHTSTGILQTHRALPAMWAQTDSFKLKMPK